MPPKKRATKPRASTTGGKSECRIQIIVPCDTCQDPEKEILRTYDGKTVSLVSITSNVLVIEKGVVALKPTGKFSFEELSVGKS